MGDGANRIAPFLMEVVDPLHTQIWFSIKLFGLTVFVASVSVIARRAHLKIVSQLLHTGEDSSRTSGIASNVNRR